jgi:hypothetical protein
MSCHSQEFKSNREWMALLMEDLDPEEGMMKVIFAEFEHSTSV